MNHRREAGKFQVAGVNHFHPQSTPPAPPAQAIQQPHQSKSVFVEKEIPRKKKKFQRD